MSFPANPIQGQSVIINEIVYTYSGDSNTWTRTSISGAGITANTGTTTFTGPVTATSFAGDGSAITGTAPVLVAGAANTVQGQGVVSGDINTFLNSGSAGWTTTTANKPGPDYGTVFGFLNSGKSQDNQSNWYNQIAFGTDGSAPYYRQKINAGAFTAWHQFLSSDNVGSYAPSLTGTGASGTWPISISGSANSAGTATLANTVTVNYNNNSDSSYQMLWGSGTSVYGSSAITCNPNTGVITATATTAQYADLAEKYLADGQYAPGTVLVFGGKSEVTVSATSHDTRIAGVVSTDPAYLMNNDSAGVAVALTGRVPCRVRGPVSKGDCLVNSELGVAGKLDTARYLPGCIIGKSLATIADNEIHTIEIAVGRF